MAIDSLMRKDWDGCPKKAMQRQKTIIEAYYRYFGEYSIPIDKQYWTLCGKSGVIPGNKQTEGYLPKLRSGCELNDILNAGLIQPNQFHGVEVEKIIYDINKVVKNISWHNDDFLNAMNKAYYDGNFNPAIINYDSVRFPTTNPNYTARLFELIVDAKIDNIMLVLNMILKSRRTWRLHANEIIKQLFNNRKFMMLWTKAERQGSPWDYEDACYEYKGTGTNSRTIMGSIVFFRRSK